MLTVQLLARDGTPLGRLLIPSCRAFPHVLHWNGRTFALCNVSFDGAAEYAEATTLTVEGALILPSGQPQLMAPLFDLEKPPFPELGRNPR